jgi:hypothetical protein
VMVLEWHPHKKLTQVGIPNPSHLSPTSP